jgi:NAD(P) transhydrogenase subunit alpha
MPDFSSDIYVFILAAFLGLEVIKRVSPMLHTPLMSLTNAISAISVIAAIELAGEHRTTLSTILGTAAVAAASTNIIGGFMITDRMLKMFKKREVKK